VAIFWPAVCLGVALRAPPSPPADEANDGLLEEDRGTSTDERDAAAFAAQGAPALQGTFLPGLVHPELTVRLVADGLVGAIGPVTTPARIIVHGHLGNSLRSPLEELRVHIVLLAPEDSARALHRLTAPPLTLTDADFSQPLPRPMASAGEDLGGLESLVGAGSAPFTATADLGDLELDPRGLPRYLATVDGFRLVAPSVEDATRILESGGTADLVALGDWARRIADGETELGGEERKQLLEVACDVLRSLRAPPALGDLHRVQTVLALMRAASDASDLQRLLELERPAKILMAGALLSYDSAGLEEALLELPVHGVHLLPGRSEYVHGYDAALQDLRRSALPQLLRLAFDPLDFRQAPDGWPRAHVQPQAATLLRPLSATDVRALLDATDGHADMQRDILSFYVEVHHAPAAEPLFSWLAEHADDAADLGARAAAALPGPLIPVLIQNFVAPDSPRRRALARSLLLALPSEHTSAVKAAFASLGVSGGVDVAASLEGYERMEHDRTSRRADALLRDLLTGSDDPLALPGRLRAAAQLAEVDGSRITVNADAVIAFLAQVAVALDSDAPSESARALEFLRTLPFGAKQDHARDAASVASARLALRRDDAAGALTALEDVSALDAAGTSVLGKALARRVDQLLATGDYGGASVVIDAFGPRSADPSLAEQLRQAVFWARWWPAFLLGGAFALVMGGTLVFLGLRALARVRERLAGESTELTRLHRRRDHALREAEGVTAGEFDSGSIADSLAFPPDPTILPEVVSLASLASFDWEGSAAANDQPKRAPAPPASSNWDSSSSLDDFAAPLGDLGALPAEDDTGSISLDEVDDGSHASAIPAALDDFYSEPHALDDFAADRSDRYAQHDG
jgi:hypothetical protein